MDGVDDVKNPMAAAGAVKDALAGGNVDKVNFRKSTTWFGTVKTLEDFFMSKKSYTFFGCRRPNGC